MSAKERVEQELNELDKKMVNLSNFMGGHNENCSYKNMSMEERFLLQLQLDVMINYKLILERRLEIWREL